MKKIELNLDPSLGDVLSADELKAISATTLGSYSGDYASYGTGKVLGDGEYVCGCSFTYDPKGKQGDGYAEYFVQAIPEPDCAAICSGQCENRKTYWEEDCVESAGWLVAGPGDVW